ncbi:hypothetical protein KC480_05080 [Bacillus velezensis]|uniref:hypothetical protein n=1 Tax=Bacillus velezensis TaxID=492670 RepID=UPI001E4B140F|nr:hypothetical protein [Bacillus velezensis]MCD7910897.1 hypothetical protein [Bacillus velezensis]
MKQSPEILAGFLQVLDEITSATQSALETLQLNAETTRLFIDEMINNPQEGDYHNSNTTRVNLEFPSETSIDCMADQIIKKIKNSPHSSCVFIISDSSIDMERVMEIVNKEFQKADIEEENIDERINFKNNFDLPFE